MDSQGSFSFHPVPCDCKCHKPSRCLNCNCDSYGNCTPSPSHHRLECLYMSSHSLESLKSNRTDFGVEMQDDVVDEKVMVCKPKLSMFSSFVSPLSRGPPIKTHRAAAEKKETKPGKKFAKSIASALQSARKKLKLEVKLVNGSSLLTVKRSESTPLTTDIFQRRRDAVVKDSPIDESIAYWQHPHNGDDLETGYFKDEDSGYSSSDLFELKDLNI